MAVAPNGKQVIDGYVIDLDHEDATGGDNGGINLLYVESEKKRIDAERLQNAKAGQQIHIFEEHEDIGPVFFPIRAK